MSAPTPVLRVEKGDDGKWQAQTPTVWGSDDVDTLDDLSGFETEEAAVDVSGSDRTMTVYLDHDGGWVTYAEAFPEPEASA